MSSTPPITPQVLQALREGSEEQELGPVHGHTQGEILMNVFILVNPNANEKKPVLHHTRQEAHSDFRGRSGL